MQNNANKNTHDHDHGFKHDLPKLINRRKFLGITTGVGACAMAMPVWAQSCISLPWETAGPYPADGSNRKNLKIVNVLKQEGVIRSDLRKSFGDYSGEAVGVPLNLKLTLLDASGCIPLSGYAIYLWACDQVGDYSLYDITDQNYLRGVGVSDVNGVVHFKTNYPGCYDGRWPHIHFEVFKDVSTAVSGDNALLTAQIAMPEVSSRLVYTKDERYRNGIKNLNRINLDIDNVFSDNTEQQLAQQTLNVVGDPVVGYGGTLTIPIDFNADRTVKIGPGGLPPGGGKSWWWPF